MPRFDRFTEETKEQVVSILFSRAMSDMFDARKPSSVLSKYSAETNVHHVPSQTTIQLTREVLPIINVKAWHLSLSFSDGYHGVQAFQKETASEWLSLVFGRWVGQLQRLPGMSTPNIHHYLLLAAPGTNELPDLEREFRQRNEESAAGNNV